ncbi:MAG: hypothetical protein QOD38_1156, partial [Acidimicrobiaceae bacterium]
AVDRWHAPPRRMPPEVASGWRASVGATALMTAVALGVHDVLEPKRHDPIIEEIDLDSLWSDQLPVSYHHVPGAPRASRAIVRPWLIADARASFPAVRGTPGGC